VLLLAFGAGASPEGLPHGHWAYSELEHFEARGLMHLPAARPYTRTQVRRWVLALDDCTARLGQAERARLTRLETEFVTGDSLWALRDDPPVGTIADGAWKAAADADVRAVGLTFHGAGGPNEGRGFGRFETLVRYGDSFVYETRYAVAVENETGRRVGENRLSSRERNWHGLTSDNDRSYVALEQGPLRASYGRDYVGWGARRGEELLVSDAGLSLDALTLRLHLGRFELSSVAAMLASNSNRYYAAHRLDIGIGPVAIGLQEVAVFHSPHFDPTYLFPISFYYGNQFNERADDNVLLGGDIKWGSPWAVLDAELLVDDFIYDGDPAPQKYGWRAGATHAFQAGGGALDVRLTYARMTRWTFTHRLATAYYVAGNGNPQSGDPFLGTALGPDADRWTAGAEWTPDARHKLWLHWARERRGDGNRDLTAWQPGTPFRLPFPSGDVRRSNDYEAGGSLRYGRHIEFDAGIGLQDGPDRREWRAESGLRLDL
jgi:hypothetical protein